MRPASPRRGTNPSASNASMPAAWDGPTTARSASASTIARRPGILGSTGVCLYPSGGWGKKEPQMTVPEVRALLVHLPDTRQWDEDEILRWSAWRQERNRIAKECHRKSFPTRG